MPTIVNLQTDSGLRWVTFDFVSDKEHALQAQVVWNWNPRHQKTKVSLAEWVVRKLLNLLQIFTGEQTLTAEEGHLFSIQ